MCVQWLHSRDALLLPAAESSGACAPYFVRRCDGGEGGQKRLAHHTPHHMTPACAASAACAAIPVRMMGAAAHAVMQLIEHQCTASCPRKFCSLHSGFTTDLVQNALAVLADLDNLRCEELQSDFPPATRGCAFVCDIPAVASASAAGHEALFGTTCCRQYLNPQRCLFFAVSLELIRAIG